MGIQCPGYCDPLDQCFRDESENVAKRAQKSYKASARKDTLSRTKHIHIDWPSPKSVSVEQDEDFECQTRAFSNLSHLSQSVEDIAIAHFMLSYIPGSHFDYLPFLYAQSASNDLLPAPIRAASIAILSRKVGRADVLDMARQSYAQALSETNASLADPLAATKDTTLISVLLLGLFEAIACSDLRTPQSWTAHTRGALALINLRGPQQLKSNVGRQLFVQVANIICVDSIQCKVRLPTELLELIAVALRYESECPKYQLARLTGEVSILLSDIDEGGLSIKEIIDATRQLDDQYVAFGISLVPPWHYQECDTRTFSLGFCGRKTHNYASHRAAQLWNSCRMTRILLNETIHSYAIRLGSVSANALQTQAAYNIQQMAVDICSSITQFKKPVEFSASPGWCLPSFPMLTVAQPFFPIPLEASTTSLLWPLSVVKSAVLASADVRAFAIDQLKTLGRDSHIPQAEEVAMDRNDISALQDGLHMFYVS
jgi:hypothetical protein|tara:strand:+ start:8929 stop:10386 length:1458 start_codon:yes stop_codon:yes gene_type:complete